MKKEQVKEYISTLRAYSLVLLVGVFGIVGTLFNKHKILESYELIIISFGFIVLFLAFVVSFGIMILKTKELGGLYE